MYDDALGTMAGMTVEVEDAGVVDVWANVRVVRERNERRIARRKIGGAIVLVVCGGSGVQLSIPFPFIFSFFSPLCLYFLAQVYANMYEYTK